MKSKKIINTNKLNNKKLF